MQSLNHCSVLLSTSPFDASHPAAECERRENPRSRNQDRRSAISTIAQPRKCQRSRTSNTGCHSAQRVAAVLNIQSQQHRHLRICWRADPHTYTLRLRVNAPLLAPDPFLKFVDTLQIDVTGMPHEVRQSIVLRECAKQPGIQLFFPLPETKIFSNSRLMRTTLAETECQPYLPRLPAPCLTLPMPQHCWRVISEVSSSIWTQNSTNSGAHV